MNHSYIDLAKKLISTASTSDNPRGLLEVLDTAKKELEEFSFQEYEKERIPSLLFFNTKEMPSEFSIILNAHLDVVPADNVQFAARIDGDKLYGRGAYDMKAAAAVEILAFKEVAKKVSYPLALQLVTDEEMGGFNGTKYQAEKGVKTKFSLVGECSSNLSIGTDEKGILWLNVTFHGTSAHGAYPWNGDNAVLQAQEFLAQLIERFPTPDKAQWQTTVNVGSIDTPNKTFNKVPDMCAVRLDVRYIPKDRDTIVNAIVSLLPKTATHEIVMFEQSHDTPPDDPYLKALSAAIVTVRKQPTQLIRMHGGSDLRHFIHTPGVEFGPVGEGHHTKEEWVSIQSLMTFYDILVAFLFSVDKK